MLLTTKSFKIFPKPNGYISESFGLNWYFFVALTNKKLLLPLNYRRNFLHNLKKLIEYSISAVMVVSSNPCVGPLPKTQISFFYYQHPPR